MHNKQYVSAPLLGTLTLLHLHTGAMTRDLTVEQYPTQKGQHPSTCIKDTTVIKLGKLPGCNLRPTSSLYSK